MQTPTKQQSIYLDEFKYYKSLAWSGLERTEEYKKLSQEEKEKIIKTAKYEREANPNNLCN